ncbi:cation-translocating P-type ATPase [Vampirovibrio sp.]|uniref:cation-translocating P-type ATPase n=1 Tax=Vampirovibrio sp. TaxID=2717857 RepID=UPI0035946CA9
MSLHSMSASNQPVPDLATPKTGPNEAPATEESHQWPCHAQSIGACLNLLKTTLQGLENAEAEIRNKASQKAEAKITLSLPPGQVFLSHLKTKLSLLFIAAAGLSFLMGQPTDGILILVALLINTGIQGIIQWKSFGGQKNQNDTADLRCTVRRNGQNTTIHARELALGDILVMGGGQMIPADARLVSSTQLQVDESPLSGESVLVPKNANDILHPSEDLTALSNMVFAGTLVKTGKGEAIVTALGSQTVMGKIAALARNTQKRESPLTRHLNALSFKIFMGVLLLIAVVIGVGLSRQMPMAPLVQMGLVMAIVAFPETIPGLASLILSVSMGRLRTKNVWVKNFQALETIGDLNVICTDKTGTLTENYLLLDQLYLPEMGAVAYDPHWQTQQAFPSQSIEALLRVGRLNNGTMLEGLRSGLMGDPIDVALYRAASGSLEAGYHQRINIPFDPVSLRSATLCENPNGQLISMIKGAPESVLEQCRFYMKPDGSLQELNLNQRSEFLMQNRQMAYENNLRVVGFAQKPMLDNDDSGPYANAIFLGWVCLIDPPKSGAREAISALKNTGARMIMITGDQKATAEMTARELGLIVKASDEVWLRSDLEAWDQPLIPDTVKVFARTKPEEKLAIVASLQQGHQVVAMVGDGVNDSPALQKSDVAIAMGLQGSQAAKECADIILLNDRLEGILHAIAESRISSRKIQSCLRYLLSCNLGLILFVTAAVLAGFGLPIQAIQLIWLSLVIVSIPAIVLAIEPVPESNVIVSSASESGEPDTQQKWRYDQAKPAIMAESTHWQQDPLSSKNLWLIAYWGMLMVIAGLGSYCVCLFLLKLSPAMAGTAAFCGMAISQTLNLFNVQAMNAGEKRSSFLNEMVSTPITWVVIGLSLLLQALTVYTPLANHLMGTVPLPLNAVFVPMAMGLGVVLFSLKTTRTP